MPFAATGPQSFIESMRLSGNDDLLGRAVQAAGCPYRRASASAPPGVGRKRKRNAPPVALGFEHLPNGQRKSAYSRSSIKPTR